MGKCLEIICLPTLERSIKLDHLSIVSLGRCLNSSSTSLSVSRIQVALLPDQIKGIVWMKNVGRNIVLVNNKSVIYPQECIILRINDTFKLPDGALFTVRLSSTDEMNRHIDIIDMKIFKHLKESITNCKEDRLKWKELDNKKLLVYQSEFSSSNNSKCKIASFDLDKTLIKTKSGKVWPVNSDDWTFLHTDIPKRLQSLYKEGYLIVVFTNQAGISLGSTNKAGFKKKVENITTGLGVPVQVYIATQYDIYRKPCPGMWVAFLLMNNISTIDYENTYYVGDAAGRRKGHSGLKRNDFSCCDRLFAKNMNLTFHTPEEFFFGQTISPYENTSFDHNSLENKEHEDYNIPSKEQEIVIMVGSPGSGKSTFVKHHLITKGYISVSRDELLNSKNCLDTVEEYLKNGNNVVVDNTNPTPESRRKYINAALKRKVSVRCFVMQTTLDCCIHNNKFRQLTDFSHTFVSEVIIKEYWKNYVPPDIVEGFCDIIKVPFIPKFSNKENNLLYFMHLL